LVDQRRQRESQPDRRHVTQADGSRDGVVADLV
jgi:hypothetical protein